MSGVSPGAAKAATYTWSSATLGGLWSTAANWNPSTGTPIAGDVAVLDTVSGTTRVVTYDTAASGAFSTLTLNQTSSGTNTLDVQRNLTVSNTITLGASGGGLTRLVVSSSSGTTSTSSMLTATGGIVLNAGGMLSLNAFNPSGTNSVGFGQVTGNITVQGGQLVVENVQKSGSANSALNAVTGTLTMTSGTLLISNTSVTDRRLQFSQVNVTGGDVLSTAAGASIVMGVTGSNTFQPTTFSSGSIQLQMYVTGSQSLLANSTPNIYARGSGVKTFTSSVTGTNFGSLILGDDSNTPGVGNTFRMGSNLTLASGRSLPTTSGNSAVDPQLRMDVGIDTGAFTLDLSSNASVFTPSTPKAFGTGTTTYWTFTGSGGRIIANGFNLASTGTASGVATSVGPGLILESRSGAGVANVLSLGSGTGSLTIDPTSIFRYAGGAALTSPSTLASTRPIGDVEVTSGALNITGLAGMSAMRVTGGSLIATNTTGLPSSAGSLTVANGATVLVGNAVDDATFGTFASGTGVAAGATFGFDTSAGDRTYAAALVPGLGFAKLGGNTLSLTASSAPASVTLNGGTTVFDPGAGGTFSTAGKFSVGSLPSGLSAATIASGSVSIAPTGNSIYVSIADATSGTSTLTVAGGAVTITSTNASGRVMVGNKSNGSLNVTGGSLTLAGGNAIYVGGDQQWAASNASGALTISGGTVAITNAGSFVLGNSGTNGNANTGVVGTLNLNGGELQTIRAITAGTSGTAANAQSSFVNFGGGLLKPLASSTTFMQGLTAAYVQNGGARIDTNGYDVTIGQALLSGTGSTGGLTKSGAGTLTLTGTSTYTGATTIAGGTLTLSGGVNRLGSSSTLAFTGGSVGLNGISQTVAGLTVSDSTSAAVVGTGTAGSTLTLSGPVSLGGGSGTSTLLFQPQASAGNANLTVTATAGGFTVNSGADLRFGAYGYTSGTFTQPNNFTGTVLTGSVTLSGGSLTLAPIVLATGSTIGTSGAVVNQVGALTMTGGRLLIDNTINGDRRLSVNGNATITGGTVGISQNVTQDMGLQLYGATNVVSPSSYDRNVGIGLYTGTSTLSAGVPLGRIFTRGSGTFTISSSATGGNIGTLYVNDGSTTPGVGSTYRLGSDLTLVAGGGARDGLPQITSYSLAPEASGRADLGIDANGFTLDLSGNPTVWQPNSTTSGTTPVQAYWQLSSASGTGRFIATGFNFVFASGSLNAYTAVGPNVVLEARGGNSTANNLGSSGTASVTIDPTSIFRYSGTAAAATPATLTAARSIGGLEVTGAGTLRVTSIGGSVGGLRISDGRLQLGGTAAIPTAPSATLSGGVLDLNGYSMSIGDLAGSGGTINTGSSAVVTLTVGGTSATRYDGVIANSSGTLNFVKQAAGSLTLGGANTFTGTTTVSAGTLVLDNALALQSSVFDTAGGGSLSFGSLTGATVGGLTGSGSLDLTGLSGGLTVGGGGRSSTFGGALSGAGGLTKTGTGTFVVTGSQAYAGATTISQGTLQIGSGSTGWLPAGAIANDGVLAFGRSDSVTFSSPISGSGSVVQSGGGALTLSGSNSHSGGTVVSGTGSLTVATAAAFGTGTITLQTSQNTANSVLNLSSGMTVTNPLVLSVAGLNRNNIVASGVTTLAGPITVSGTGVNAQVIATTGSLTVAGNITAPGSFNGSLSFRTGSITISGTVNAPQAGFDLNVGGTTLVTSTGNVWSYVSFNASNSTLRVGANNALATNAVVNFSPNSTGGGLDLNGFNQSIPGFYNGSGTIPAPRNQIFNNASGVSTLTLAGLTADRSSTVAITDGVAGGKVALVMNSAGRRQTLASATSSYSGGTRLVAGTLAQGAANALGATGGGLAIDGGTLDLGGYGLTVGLLSGSAGGVITSGTAGAVTFAASSNADSTFGGLIQDGLGTVGFAKGGSGKLTLTAANTYTGPTQVNGGVLAVNGSLAGSVAVAAGGEIGGTGSVGGLSGAGLVGPGNSPGILTSPSVDPAGGLSFAFEFTQAAPDYANAAASGNDLLWLTGGTPFTSALSGGNTVSIYLAPSVVELSEVTGGFFTQTAGDFLASIQAASFQFFVQDAQGSFTYNGSQYKTLSQYDASKSISVATVAQNGGQVMQLVVVPEPGAVVLAGIGVAAAAWGWSRRKTRG